MIMIGKRIFSQVEYVAITLIYFLFLYGFSLPVVGNSSYLGAFLLFFVFLKKGVINEYLHIIRNRFVVLLICGYFFMSFFSVLTSVFNGTYDYSINTTLVNNLISVLVTCICIAYFSIVSEDINKSVFYFLSTIFLSQCIIIFIMLLFPDFRELIQGLIRDEAQLERMSSYNGVRGLGLTGFVAFGFSITMGLLFPIFCYWLKFYSRLSDSLKIASVILGVIACLSAGRTSILGVFLGFFILIYNERFNLRYFIKVLKITLILFILSLALIYYIFSNDAIYEVAYYYSRYVFQSIWNYVEFGSFSVNSLEQLDSMYFYPDNFNWLLGSGNYTNDDGSYYMYTDAGYMRFVLFFGLLGSFFIYSLFCFFSVNVIFKEKTAALKILLIMTFISSFIYHYKGETIMFSVPYMKVYLLVFLVSLLSINYKESYD